MTGVTRPPATRTTPDANAIPDCPYKGLMPYTERDAAYFFGRDQIRDLVIANLRASRLTVLYGSSGVGKSSLLRAGVIRQLTATSDDARTHFARRPFIVAYHSTWRDDPLIGLAAALRDALQDHVVDDDLVPAKASLSVELLRQVTKRLDANVVLVCDQFEEVTLYQPGAAGDALAAELGRIIAATDVRVAVLIGIRDDAFARLDRFEADIPNLFDNFLGLDHLDLAAAREAIERPVLHYNTEVPPERQVSIEPELVKALLEQLRTGCVSVVDGGRGGVDFWPQSRDEARRLTDGTSETIETPFLQLVMTRLWSEEAARQSRTLRRSTLNALGGAEQIVRTHLDSVMSELSDDQREVAARIFRHLVTRSGMKIAYTAEDLAYIAEIDDRARVMDVLERLSAGRERVLRPVPPPVGEPGTPRYEIFHDVMAPAVLDWRRRYVAERERADSERALVRAKHEAEERDRESRRRLRISLMVSATLALLLVAVFGLGFVAWLNGAAAKRQAQLAEYEKNLNSNPAASLNAALQAWRNKPWWQKHDPPAETAVRNALDANKQRAVLRGHRGNVVTSQFAPDGGTVLTAGEDGTAALFRTSTAELLHRLTPSGDGPRSLTGALFSPDGSMVVTAATNGQVLVYDAVSGQHRATLADSGGPAFATWGSLRGRPVVLTYGPHGTPALWDPATPKRRIARYGTSETAAGGADLSRDGRYVVTVGSDAMAQVWEATSGKLLASKDLGNKAAQPLFVTTTSGGVAVSAMERQIWEVVFWDWRVGSVKPTGVVGPEPQQFAVSKDGGLVAANRDKSVIVLDGETGTMRGFTPDARDRVTAIDFSRDGRRLAIGDDNGSALIWNTAEIEQTNPATNGGYGSVSDVGQTNPAAIMSGRSPRPVAELLAPSGSVSDVRFDPHDGSASTVVTAGGDGKARTWRLPSYLRVSGAAGSFVFDADASRGRVVTAESSGGDGWLRVRRSDNGALEREWFRPGKQLRQAVFTPDAAKIVAVATVAYRPLVWAWRTNDELRLVENDKQITPSLATSPDGRTVAAPDFSNRVIVWDLNTGKIRVRLGDQNNENQVQDVAYIGSTRLAVASSDGTIRIWDLHDPSRPKDTLPQGDEAGGITAIAVSRDDTHLVTVAEDRKLRVWNVSDGRPNVTISTQVGTIKDITFSPDGSFLVAGVADGAVHMWRWRDRDNREFAVLRRHSEAVDSVRFTADGKNMVTVGSDAIATIYPCTVCRSFPAELHDAKQQNRLFG